MNLPRLLLLTVVGGAALAYWQRQRILAYIASATADKIKSTASDYIPSF